MLIFSSLKISIWIPVISLFNRIWIDFSANSCVYRLMKSLKMQLFKKGCKRVITGNSRIQSNATTLKLPPSMFTKSHFVLSTAVDEGFPKSRSSFWRCCSFLRGVMEKWRIVFEPIIWQLTTTFFDGWENPVRAKNTVHIRVRIFLMFFEMNGTRYDSTNKSEAVLQCNCLRVIVLLAILMKS